MMRYIYSHIQYIPMRFQNHIQIQIPTFSRICFEPPMFTSHRNRNPPHAAVRVAVAVSDFLAFATFVDVVAFVLVVFVLDAFVLVVFVLVAFVTVLVVLVALLLLLLLMLLDIFVLETTLDVDVEEVTDDDDDATTPLTQYAVFAHRLSHAASMYVFQLWNCANVMLCAVSTL